MTAASLSPKDKGAPRRVVCIDCGAAQTHRVCAECFEMQQEAATAYVRRMQSHRGAAHVEAEVARIQAIPHNEYLPSDDASGAER